MHNFRISLNIKKTINFLEVLEYEQLNPSAAFQCF